MAEKSKEVAAEEISTLGNQVELSEEEMAKLVTAATEEQQADPREEEVPEVHLLMSLQKNLFCDAAFQSMAIAMLGTAIGQNPELNDPDRYKLVDFSAKNNCDWDKYTIQERDCYQCCLKDMPRLMSEGVEKMGQVLKEVVESSTVILGTLRAYAHFNPCQNGGDFTITLVWIEEKA
jgi:hypothetical protein